MLLLLRRLPESSAMLTGVESIPVLRIKGGSTVQPDTHPQPVALVHHPQMFRASPYPSFRPCFPCGRSFQLISAMGSFLLLSLMVSHPVSLVTQHIYQLIPYPGSNVQAGVCVLDSWQGGLLCVLYKRQGQLRHCRQHQHGSQHLRGEVSSREGRPSPSCAREPLGDNTVGHKSTVSHTPLHPFQLKPDLGNLSRAL